MGPAPYRVRRRAPMPMSESSPKFNPAASAESAGQRVVARVVGDFRRGQPVGLRAADRSACVAVPAELVDEEALRRLAALGPVQVALTAQRTRVLNIAPTGAETAILELPDGADLDLLQALADPTADLDHPLMGPFRVADGAALEPAGAALILCKLARLLPAAAIAAVTAPEQPGPGGSDSDWLWIDADQARQYGERAAATLHKVSEARVPLQGAENARVIAFRPADGSTEHIAIVIGDPNRRDPVLVRLHSACFTGDLLSSLRCDCGEQLRGAITLMAEQGSGVLIYLAQEGRGIGLVNKLRAYRLQDQGHDTFAANQRLGFEDDERVFAPAARILDRLGFSRVRLLTNNPDKIQGLERHGIEVTERVPHAFPPNNHNEAYLATKGSRGGHLF